MTVQPEIHVSRVLDEGGLSAFQIKMLLWTILIGVIDGYDIGAIAFAAPHLVPSWGISAACARPRAQRQQYRRPVRFGSCSAGSATAMAARRR